MSANKLEKQKVKSHADSVRRILNAWDPIPGSPEDEYDCLVDHIVSALYRGIADTQSLAMLIESELMHHFGIKETESTISEVASEIAAYWKGHRQ
jgi:hypothetical protein